MKSKLKTRVGKISFSWKKGIWLYLMLLPILIIDFSQFQTRDLVLNIIFLFLTVGFGHSIGLHRGIIHKSYKTTKYFRWFSLYLFVFTGLGSH